MKSFTITAILAAATSLVSAAPADTTGGNPCNVIRCASGTICQVSGDGQSGRCVPEAEQQCGPNVVCGHGSRCCNPLRGICVSPPNMFCIMSGGPVADEESGEGTVASESAPAADATITPPPPVQQLEQTTGQPGGNNGTFCGPNVCHGDETCCNSSCGYCTKPGQGCTREFCAPGSGPKCGKKAVCPFGWECCNDSCGSCVRPGGMCTMQFCSE
ncbi:hypothetical protein PspLS_10600 [Pyricularia sp. CBS 133598]|nr:hypothetical protein PspLS_10600 [Pyricularia sp. CBS 133598]